MGILMAHVLFLRASRTRTACAENSGPPCAQTSTFLCWTRLGTAPVRRSSSDFEHVFDTGGVEDDLERDLARRASQSWDAHREDWQAILNAHPIPPLRVQAIARDLIPVTARIVWERDGVETVETVVAGWTSCLVLVLMSDRRTRTRGVWLDPADVRRREPRVSP